MQTLEGTRNPTLESAKLDLERASAMEDFGSAIDWVTSASKKLERFLGAAEGETPMNDADVVADAIAEPLDRGETVASLKSRQAAKKREADLSRKRSSVAEEFGDIFADILPRYGKRADQDVQPDVAEAKAAISGRSKAELANTPDATATTDACELAGQKSAPDAGGVPRVAGKDDKAAGGVEWDINGHKGGADASANPGAAGDINISMSTEDGKSKVKSKLPLGDGPKSEDKSQEKINQERRRRRRRRRTRRTARLRPSPRRRTRRRTRRKQGDKSERRTRRRRRPTMMSSPTSPLHGRSWTTVPRASLPTTRMP